MVIKHRPLWKANLFLSSAVDSGGLARGEWDGLITLLDKTRSAICSLNNRLAGADVKLGRHDADSRLEKAQ